MADHTIPTERIDEIRAAEPKAIFLSMELGGDTREFAFRRPKRQHVQLATSTDRKKVGGTMDRMVRDLVLFPGPEDAAALFDEYPGAPIALAAQLLEAVGVSEVTPLRP